MIQEDKQLLLKDLCARLPYGVHGEYSWKCGKPYERELTGNLMSELILSFNSSGDSEFKPYLRPMSSMTDEERLYFHRNSARVQILVDEEKLITKPFYGYTIHLFDWLNAHHFDYHNLIGKSLAFEAPEGMYDK